MCSQEAVMDFFCMNAIVNSVVSYTRKQHAKLLQTLNQNRNFDITNKFDKNLDLYNFRR